MIYHLQEKKVLLVAPQFFGYERDIRDELERRGAKVDFLLDRPFTSPLLKAITRWRRQWVMAAAQRYYEAHTDLGADYDYVFVVNGQTLSSTLLEQWKHAFPRASFLLYMWDSFGNRKDVVANLRYFDHAFTFDRQDAKEHDIHFRPLFFSKGFECSQGFEQQWDISFIGTAHTDRYPIVAKVSEALAPSVRRYWYLYLQAPWVFWLYRAINPGFRSAPRSAFQFDPLTKADVQEVFFASGAILDIEHPQQTGLTMRTLETLGARKKLITTNISVCEYDFFDSANICVLDRNDPVVPPGFLEAPYIDVSPAIYQRYRLEGWLDEILQKELS